MTEMQSLRRGVRHRVGLGNGSRGDKAMLLEFLVPKLRCVLQTPNRLLRLVSGKAGDAATLVAKLPCPAGSSSVRPVPDLSTSSVVPCAQMPAVHPCSWHLAPAAGARVG